MPPRSTCTKIPFAFASVILPTPQKLITSRAPSGAPHDDQPVALPRPHSTPAAFLRQYFYFCMSLLIAVVVVYGFSQTIGHNLLHASPLPPFILTIHAIVFPGWVLFFILQSALVRTRNVPLHRTLGWFGLALGIGILVLGYVTATTMDRFRLQHHHHRNPRPSSSSS